MNKIEGISILLQLNEVEWLEISVKSLQDIDIVFVEIRKI